MAYEDDQRRYEEQRRQQQEQQRRDDQQRYERQQDIHRGQNGLGVHVNGGGSSMPQYGQTGQGNTVWGPYGWEPRK